MPFDAEKFERAEFKPRTATHTLTVLAAFFDAGEKPDWTVRGLSGTELYSALEASKRQGSVESIVAALASKGDQIEAIRKAIGLAANTPGEMAKRLEMLTLGSVSPKIDLPTAVKLAHNFAVEFMILTNSISELTGEGSDLVKPEAASPQTENSSSACASSSSEAATSTSTAPT